MVDVVGRRFFWMLVREDGISSLCDRDGCRVYCDMCGAKFIGTDEVDFEDFVSALWR